VIDEVVAPVDHTYVNGADPVLLATVRVLLCPAQIVAGLVVTVGVGKALMVITITSDAAGHGPAGSFVVIVSVTVPALYSATLGVYTGFSVVKLGE
jgi:hypothetical protein